MRPWMPWIGALVLAGAITGCGRQSESDKGRDGGQQGQTQPLTLANARLVCTIETSGRTGGYQVIADQADAKAYGHAVLQQASGTAQPAVVGDYADPRDTTPPPPTDLRYRLVFGDDAYTVTLMAGGFTQKATALVQATDGGAILASLSCLEQAASPSP